jgi:hypothetical protein
MDKVLWKVPVHKQKTAKLCWEACARMMWHWRFKNLNHYKSKAGSYLSLSKGLEEPEMDIFYKSLGLRSHSDPVGTDLRLALKGSPVIFDEISEDSTWGHAAVLVGFDGTTYVTINPCSTQTVDFATDEVMCSHASHINRRIAAVEEHLGRYIWYW